MVDVKLVRKFSRTITLTELKGLADRPELEEFPLVRKGNRLSVMPVTEEQWAFILGLE
jgi:predicted RNA-binding protein with PUA-like domain